MKTLKLIFAFLLLALTMNAQEMVTFSGTVSDYNGEVIPNADVTIKDAHFNDLYTAKSDAKGHYSLTIPKGRYPYLFCMDMAKHPSYMKKLEGHEDEARLEMWWWDVVADEDKKIDLHYGRFECYALHVFKDVSAKDIYNIFVRPMGCTRYFQNKKDLKAHLAPTPDKMEVRVEVDGVGAKVIGKQPIREYYDPTNTNNTIDAYIISVAVQSQETDKKYNIFRLVIKDLENGDEGEALCTYWK